MMLEFIKQHRGFQFTKKLRNTVAELEKNASLIKKACIS